MFRVVAVAAAFVAPTGDAARPTSDPGLPASWSTVSDFSDFNGSSLHSGFWIAYDGTNTEAGLCRLSATIEDIREVRGIGTVLGRG
jgi:hypothetical protein